MARLTAGEVILPTPANLLRCLPCSAEFVGGLRVMDCMAWMCEIRIHSGEFWQSPSLAGTCVSVASERVELLGPKVPAGLSQGL